MMDGADIFMTLKASLVGIAVQGPLTRTADQGVQGRAPWTAPSVSCLTQAYEAQLGCFCYEGPPKNCAVGLRTLRVTLWTLAGLWTTAFLGSETKPKSE